MTGDPKLTASSELTAALSRLPQPEPPAELTAAILARIARIEPSDDARNAAARSTRLASFGLGEWPAYATVAGALAIGLTFVVSLRLQGVMRPMLGLAWAAALFLYVFGLFAPIGHKRPS